MIKGVRILIVITLLIFTINFILAESINDNLHLNIQAINSSGDVVIGTFPFIFNISTTSDCANVVYTKSESLTTDSRGIISYYLENTQLDYTEQYWLCYYRNGTLINASKISQNAYTFYANNSKNWNGLSSYNSTQISNSNGLLNILESWLKGLFYTKSEVDANLTLINTTLDNKINNVNSTLITINTTLTSINNTLNIQNLYNSTLTQGLNYVNNTVNIQNLYNSTLTQGLNSINTTANIQNLINGTNANFSNADFNNGWTSGGISILGGNLFAQALYVYNISSVNVNNINSNGSIFPSFDNMFDLGNSSMRWKNIFTSGDINFNGSITGTGNIVSTGNITSSDISATNYFYGQPLAGKLGSGMIDADAVDLDAGLDLTYSGTGLDITYPSFTMRLVNTSNYEQYCNIPGATVTVPNNAETVYYIDSDCVVQNVPIATYLATSVSPGGLSDFMTISAHSGNIEAYKGITLGNKEYIKQRRLNFFLNNLKVYEGFQQGVGPGMNLTIFTGKYIFDTDLVNWSIKNTTAGDRIEIAYPVGGVWTFADSPRLNISSCTDGTNIANCTNTTSFKRTFIFATGFKDGTDGSEILQLLPSQTENYPDLATCFDTTTYPLTYTLPTEYQYAAVPLYAYCGQALDTSLASVQMIDSRTVKSGSSSTGVLGNYVTTDGTTPLTGNWDVGNFNITNISQLGIGTNSPGQKLEVIGNVNISRGNFTFGGLDPDTLSNFYIGDGTIASQPFTGSSAGGSVDRTKLLMSSMFTFSGVPADDDVAGALFSTQVNSTANDQEHAFGIANVLDIIKSNSYNISNSVVGIQSVVNHFGKGNIAEIDGLVASAYLMSSGGADEIRGVKVGIGAPNGIGADANFTGTIPKVYGVSVDIGFDSGNYTDIYFFRADGDTNAYNPVGFNISNAYGLFIGNLSGDNTYGIYQVNSSNKNYFAGNIGIGTTSPTDKLTISGAAPQLGINSSNSVDAQLRFYNASTLSSIIYRPGNTNDLRFYVGGSDRITINSSTGNVGIGTTTPQYGKLEIATGPTINDGLTLYPGTGNTTARLWINQSSDVFTITRGGYLGLSIQNITGNIGIGTSSPAYKLEVNGTMNVSTTSTSLAVNENDVRILI